MKPKWSCVFLFPEGLSFPLRVRGSVTRGAPRGLQREEQEDVPDREGGKDSKSVTTLGQQHDNNMTTTWHQHDNSLTLMCEAPCTHMSECSWGALLEGKGTEEEEDAQRGWWHMCPCLRSITTWDMPGWRSSWCPTRILLVSTLTVWWDVTALRTGRARWTSAPTTSPPREYPIRSLRSYRGRRNSLSDDVFIFFNILYFFQPFDVLHNSFFF